MFRAGEENDNVIHLVKARPAAAGYADRFIKPTIDVFGSAWSMILATAGFRSGSGGSSTAAPASVGQPPMASAAPAGVPPAFGNLVGCAFQLHNTSAASAQSGIGP